ncbi:MAG TPA: RDD family protein [Oligoflexia bacterium]|nr:RDD family protein [Oligoflexia bacterium]HMP47113.1 RDD family protein [Oligoflexia bacterium]
MKSKTNGNEIYSGFTLDQPACPIPRRIIAYSIDLGIVTAVFYTILILFGIFMAMLGIGFSAIFNESEIKDIFGGILLAVFGFIALIIILGTNSAFFIYYELKHGGTPGKKLLGLRVISVDGRPLSLKQCVYRDLMRIVDAVLLLPGLITMLLNQENKRLGDFAAGTMVIYIERNAKEADFFYITQNEYADFHEKLNPNIPSTETISNFLKLALGSFHLGKGPIPEYDKWSEIARSHFNSPLAEIIDSETALLFFAEHCHQHQLVNLNKSKKKKGEVNDQPAYT